MEILRVGSNVDAWCTKCKITLAHTIEAIADGRIKRVQCNTCRGNHQFKADPKSKKGSIKVKVVKASKPKSRTTDYTRLLQGKDVANAQSYAVAKQFAKGDIIRHAQFGLGVVVEAKDNSKIEVLFESGPRILVQGRTEVHSLV